MTRFILLSTVATLAAAPVFAQSTMSNDAMPDSSMSTAMSGLTGADNIDNMIRSSEIVGGDIYALDRDYSDDEWDVDIFQEVDAKWENIGNVTDIVFTEDGRTAGLIVSAGGFLDIGDDTVVLSMADVRRIATSDGEIDYVVRMTEEKLEELPQVMENWW